MTQQWITQHSGEPPRLTRRLSAIQLSDRTTTFQKFLAMQKLKKAALVLIAGCLTQAEVADLGEIFRQVDKQGDGVMTLTELDDAISRGRFRNIGV
jgi:calcium-dependent protein kinase